MGLFTLYLLLPHRQLFPSAITNVISTETLLCSLQADQYTIFPPTRAPCCLSSAFNALLDFSGTTQAGKTGQKAQECTRWKLLFHWSEFLICSPGSPGRLEWGWQQLYLCCREGREHRACWGDSAHPLQSSCHLLLQKGECGELLILMLAEQLSAVTWDELCDWCSWQGCEAGTEPLSEMAAEIRPIWLKNK